VSPAARGGPSIYRRILCATDASPETRRATDQALALAELLGAELLALYVVDVDYHTGIHLRAEVLEEEQTGLACVNEVVAEAQQRGVAARPLLVKGEPGPTILDVAESEGADLVVLGRHGQGLLEKVLLGSVASYVAEHSRVAVLLVPG